MDPLVLFPPGFDSFTTGSGTVFLHQPRIDRCAWA
jgi:hypothetical protein